MKSVFILGSLLIRLFVKNGLSLADVQGGNQQDGAQFVADIFQKAASRSI